MIAVAIIDIFDLGSNYMGPIDQLVMGITIGATAGLISGIILGLVNWATGTIGRRLERRDQIRHLATTVEGIREKIFNATDLDLTNHPIGGIVSQEKVRKAHLNWLHQQVESILLGRASRLTYDEKQEIKQVFRVLDLHPEFIPNDREYRRFFDEFATVRWLGLR